MAAHFDSKHGTVSRPREELYMAFTDLRNFVKMLPEDRKQDVTATYDSMSATVQGFTLGVRVTRREPYSYMELQDDGAPFKFTVGIHFDESSEAFKTDFHIEVDAELNIMMKMMLGSRLKEALDKMVDSLVDVSEGRMPEGFPADMKM